MKNRKTMFILLEAVLAVAAVAVGILMLWGKTNKPKDKIAVIIENSDDSQWTAFKHGLKMGAMDYGLEILVVNTTLELTLEQQRELIENELENGASAVIVQPIGGYDSEQTFLNVQSKAPIILVESAASQRREDSLLPVIQPDNYGMGEALAREMIEDYSDHLNGKTIGIVASDSFSESIINRRDGLIHGLEGSGAEIKWSMLDFENEAEIRSREKTDFIVALDNNSVKDLGREAASNNIRGSIVYGIGRSTEAVYYADTGIVKCLIVPDEFSLGYDSMSEISKKLDGPFYKIKDKVATFTVMRQGTLFSDANQAILYTMSQ